MSAEVRNLAEVRVSMERLKESLHGQVRRALKVSALGIQNAARLRVPVDLGRLRNSIAHEVDEGAFSARVGTNVNYARAIEFGRRPGAMMPPGTLIDWMKRKGIDERLEFVIRRAIAERGTRPQPFLVPSFEEEAPRFRSSIARLEVRA